MVDEPRTVALLRKETAPLLIPFLYDSFRQANRVSYKHNELLARLNDLLFALNDTEPAGDEAPDADRRRYPRTAKQYLEEWIKDSTSTRRTAARGWWCRGRN